MKDKILITGSLGQLGSYLSEYFLEKNLTIVGLDNESNPCPKISEKVKELTIKGDIRDEKLVEKLIKDVDVIIHCAAQVSVKNSLDNPAYDAENNILGTIALLNKAKEKTNLKRFIYISSAATYGKPIRLPIDEKHPQNPLSPYGLSKLTAEKYVNMFSKIHKVPAVVIRIFNIYSKRADINNPYSGVITRFIGQSKENKPPIIEGDGEQTRDFIYIKDVANMINLILNNKESTGETFNCGSGKPTTIKEIADKIISISGKNTDMIFKDKRKGDIKHSYADISKAKKVLGFKPEIDLTEGIKELMK